MNDHIAALLLLWLAVEMTVYGIKRHRREQRAADWESHVTSAPGLAPRASDWDAWSDELRGRA